MATMTVELRNIAGTDAALGWAGAHTIVVDRPDGKAGGKGLGFNGGELLAMAIGGCFCNDLRYAAEELGTPISTIALSVTIELSGAPLLATAATLTVNCELADGTPPAAVITRAEEITMVSNSVRRGFPVMIVSTC